MSSDVPLVPLTTLLCAYAGRDIDRQRLIWAFDARLAHIVRTTNEPMIGQMRLAWWQDVLADDSGAKGRGEPLLAALRDAGVAGNTALDAMLDGWEALLGDAVPDDIALRCFAMERGGGLFRALAGGQGHPEGLSQAGTVWALWDLSGHVGSASEATQAIAVAHSFLDAGDPQAWTRDWPRTWRPMRLAFGLALQDVRRGQVAPRSLTPRLYARLWRLALVGR